MEPGRQKPEKSREKAEEMRKVGNAVVTLKKGEGRTIKSGGAWIYDNEIDAYNKEAEIVNFDFIKRRDNYNTSIGGIFSGKQYKYIYQYDLNGNFIKEWFSV